MSEYWTICQPQFGETVEYLQEMQEFFKGESQSLIFLNKELIKVSRNLPSSQVEASPKWMSF